MKKRISIFLCLGLLLVSLLPLTGFAAADPYFLAVNDNLPEPSVYNTPIYIGEVTYIPYTAFDSRYAEVSLGISAKWYKDSGTVELSTSSTVLKFDLNNGKVSDYPNGTYFAYHPAVLKNGIPYLPAANTCGYFGLDASFRAVEGCWLLRIKNSNAVLSDELYIQTVSSILKSRVDKYHAQEKPGSSNPGGNNNQPTPVEPEEPGEGGQVYLAFEVGSGAGLLATLSALQQQGNVSAIFFFEVDQLATMDTLLLEVVTQGHRVGLMNGGKSGPVSLESLTKGNDVLGRILRQRALFVLDEGFDAATKEELKGAGYLLWLSHVTAGGRGQSESGVYNGVLKDVKEKSGRIRLYFKEDVTARTVSSVLRQLKEERVTFRISRESGY